MGIHQIVNAKEQIQLSSLNTEETVETVDQEPSDQKHTFDHGDAVYWNFYVWQGELDCPGDGQKHWSDWVVAKSMAT